MLILDLEHRTARFYRYADTNDKREARKNLKEGKHAIEYFWQFYNNNILDGSTPWLMHCYAFFGVEHLLIGADMPYTGPVGDKMISITIQSIEQMEITNTDKKKILEDNTRKLLHLSI